MSKERRDRVSDLPVLGCSVSFEEVVVWECLDPRGLAYRQTSHLSRIRMDICVSVTRDVARDRGSREITKLYSKAVSKLVKVSVLALYVGVVGQEGFREVLQFRRAAQHFRERG